MNTASATNELAMQPEGAKAKGVDGGVVQEMDDVPADSPRATMFSRVGLQNVLKTSLFRNVVGTVGSQFGIFGVQALHSIVLARLLGPTQRGEYATAVFFSQVLLYAGLLGTLFSIARRAAIENSNRNALSNASVRVGMFTGICCFGVVTILAYVGLPKEKAYIAALCILAAAQLPFEHARLALLSVDHGSGQFRTYNYNRLFSATVFLVLLGACWLFASVSLEVVVGMVVLSSIIGLVQLIYSHAEVRWRAPSSPTVKVLMKEGLPYSAGYFAAQLLGRLDTLLMLWFMSFTNQGLYAVALAAAGLLHIVPNALALFAFNLGAKATLSRSRRSLRLAVLSVLGIQFSTAIVFALVLGPLLILLFGSKFGDALPMTLALLPGLAIEGAGIIAEGYLRGRGRPFSTLRPRMFGAAIMLPTVFLLNNYWHDLCIPLGASVAQAFSGLAILWVFLKDEHEVSRDKA